MHGSYNVAQARLKCNTTLLPGLQALQLQIRATESSINYSYNLQVSVFSDGLSSLHLHHYALPVSYEAELRVHSGIILL